MPKLYFPTLLATGLVLSACQSPATGTDTATVVEVQTPAGPTAEAQLAAMDMRVPLPLQPMMANHMKQMMRGHLEALQAINTSLATEDWDGVLQAAALLGSGSEGRKMCRRMGAGAAGFYEMGVSLHTQADGIAAAAKAHDLQGVLQATSRAMATCTACHATYQQEVLSSEDYQLQLEKL